MSLRQKQSKFAEMAAKLILKAIELGFEVTLGDAYRDARVFGAMGERKGYGESRSAHNQRLALNINLGKAGRYSATHEGHQQLGEWWESQGGAWGGRFDDPNHYSLEHGGIK